MSTFLNFLTMDKEERFPLCVKVAAFVVAAAILYLYITLT